MNNYRLQLINSLKQISHEFMVRNERDFCYELYHQVRKLNIGIDVTAETPKSSYRIPALLVNNSFFNNHFFSSKNFDVTNNCFNRTPDLLIHEYDNKNKQLFAVEIKPLNKQNDHIFKDVAKLMFYTESALEYKSGILILFSSNENNRKIEQLKNQFQKTLKDFSKIEIWIVYPSRIHVIWAGGKTCEEIYAEI